MRAKYNISTSPISWSGPLRCSKEWKDILSVKQVFSELCAWTVGKGNISFWYDRWIPEFHLALFSDYEESNVKLREFWHGGRWHFDDLAPSLGHELVQLLYDVTPNPSENDDVRHWTPDHTGSFSLKSAWNAIRHRDAPSPIIEEIWSTVMPLSAKLICWRIFHNILPTDLSAQRSGISLASRCVCCSNHQTETLNHLFIQSELALSLWKFFSAVFAIPYFPQQSIFTRIKWWFLKCKGKSQFSMLGRLACIAICRQIWSFRNKCIYGGMVKGHLNARLVVIDTLQHLDHLLRPVMSSSKFGIDSLLLLGIKPRSPRAKKTFPVAWVPPSAHAYALNVDGSCRGGMLAVGGVIRDHNGSFLCAFAGPIGSGSSLQSEIQALSTGVELISEIGLHPSSAQSDSKTLVSMIGRKCPYWQLHQKWKELHHFLQSIPVTHCFREGNTVADALSKLGHSMDSICYYFQPQDLPRDIQHLIWLDRMGTYYSRYH